MKLSNLSIHSKVLMALEFLIGARLTCNCHHIHAYYTMRMYRMSVPWAGVLNKDPVEIQLLQSMCMIIPLVNIIITCSMVIIWLHEHLRTNLNSVRPTTMADRGLVFLSKYNCSTTQLLFIRPKRIWIENLNQTRVSKKSNRISLQWVENRNSNNNIALTTDGDEYK